MTSLQMVAAKHQALALRREMAAGPVPTLDESRASMDARFGSLPPVGGASHADVDLGGVPAEWAIPDGPRIAGTLLYFHGGAYCLGSIFSHRRLVTSMCVTAGMRGLSIGYRLAPEHPFPAALEDALAAYGWLIGEGGESPGRVIIAGDSAGGGLALATLVALRDGDQPLPAGALLFSPWTDLTLSGSSMHSRAEADPVLTPAMLQSRVALYVPEGDLHEPLISPRYADLSGLPSILVQVGEAEILFDDAADLVERAQTAGVTVDLQPWPEAFHGFQLMVGVVPEADEAVAKASAWAVRQLESDADKGEQ